MNATRANRILCLVFASILLVGVFPLAEAAQEMPVSTAQQAVITSAPPVGAGTGAPWGEWTNGITTATFYLHQDPAVADTTPGQCATSVYQNFVMNTKAPVGTESCQAVRGYTNGGPDNQDANSHYPQSSWDLGYFINTPPHTLLSIPVLNVTSISDMKATVYVRGAPSNTLLRARVYETDAGGTTHVLAPNRVDNSDGQTKASPCAADSAGCHYIAQFMLRPSSQAVVNPGRPTAPDIIPYFGETPQAYFGTYGYHITEGHGLIFEVVPILESCVAAVDYRPIFPGTDSVDGSTYCPGPAVTVVFDTNTYNSNLQVVSDSARVNVWTENPLNEVMTNFPSSARGTIGDRRVVMKSVIADTWGNLEGTSTGGVCAGDIISSFTQPANLCPNDNLDQNNIRIRVRDMTSSHSGPNGYCVASSVDPTVEGYRAPSANHLCYHRLVGIDQGYGLNGNDNGIQDSYLQCCNIASTQRLILYKASSQELQNGIGEFSYVFHYNETLPNGDYRIEFQDSRNGWLATHDFHVGQNGWTFEFAPYEPSVAANGSESYHQVALNQPTDYSLRITNNGADTDSYGLSVSTPGSGWTASVEPPSVTLSPGRSTDVTLHVVPTPGGKIGDVRVVSVNAVSLRDSSQKTLFTLTQLVGLQTHQVKLSTDRLPINTRPGVTTTFPLRVINLGTREDQFAVVGSGLPVGWSLTVDPTVVDVYAQSYQVVIVTLHAPNEAVPGTSFSLVLSGQDTQGLGNTDQVSISVVVYTVAGLKIDALGGNGCPNSDPRDTGSLIPVPGVACITPLREVAGSFYPVCQNGVTGSGTCIPDAAPEHQHLSYGQPEQDTHFGNAVVYRVRFTNTGDTQDKFNITGAWNPAVGDTTACDGTGDNFADGVPNGWRIKVLKDANVDPLNHLAAMPDHNGNLGQVTLGDAPFPVGVQVGLAEDGMTNGFSGEMPIGILTLPAHTSQDVYFDMGWIAPFDSTNNNYPIAGGTGNNDACDSLGDGNHPEYDWRNGPNSPPADCHLLVILGCTGGVDVASGAAEFRMNYRSQNDYTLRGYVVMHADKVYPSPLQSDLIADKTTYGTKVEMGIDRQTGIVSNSTEIAPINSGNGTIYDLIITNTGNSVDTLKAKLRFNQANGWTHRFLPFVPCNAPGPCTTAQNAVIVNSDYLNFPDQGTPTRTCPAGTPGSAIGAGHPNTGCDKTARMQDTGLDGTNVPYCEIEGTDATQIVCSNLGVFDSALLRVQVVPPLVPGPNNAWLPAHVGDLDITTVAVTSDQGTLNSGYNAETDQTLKTIAGGDYGFRLFAHPTKLVASGTYQSETREAYPGEGRVFPFTIQNVGTADDYYHMQVIEGTDVSGQDATNWHPHLESVNTVRVPAGSVYHGFLQVVSPTLGNVSDGQVMHFRVEFQSLAPITASHLVDQVDDMDFYAVVRLLPGDLSACSINSEPVTIPPLGEDRSRVTVQCLAGSHTTVDMNVDPAELPENWAFVCLDPVNPKSIDSQCDRTQAGYTPDFGDTKRDTREFAGDGKAIGDFDFHVPPGELGASRMCVQVAATFDDPADAMVKYGDICVNLKTTYGINLTVLDPQDPSNTDPSRIVFPPGNLNALGLGVPITLVHYDLDVENTGLSEQTVTLTNTPLPCNDAVNGSQCWRIHFATPTFKLGPGQHKVVEADVEVPVDSPAGASALIEVCATVADDGTQVSCRFLRPEVGKFGVGLDTPAPALVAPQETADFLLTVRNTGTVDDYIHVYAQLGLPSISSNQVTWDYSTGGLGGVGQCDAAFDSATGEGNYFAIKDTTDCEIFVKAGQARQVNMHLSLPLNLQQLAPTQTGQTTANIPIAILAQSRLSTMKLVQANANAVVHILDYVAADVDQDGVLEYAINRDLDANGVNGYEQFRENLIQGGVTTKVVPLCRFLNADALKTLCGGSTTGTYFVDGDGDGKADFFLDTNNGDLPTVYFHADKSCSTHNVENLTLAKDVVGNDGLPEYFVDLGDGGIHGPQKSSCADGLLDHYFDLATGKFGDLVQVYADQDSNVDYVVDLNGNNAMDPGEPLLFGGPDGGITKVQKQVDMNGDGNNDLVVDITNGPNDAVCLQTQDNPEVGRCNGDSPEFFFPAGNTTAIQICLKDVTGDGVADWTYDSQGRDCHRSDVTADSYYNPVTGDTGYIHPESVLLHNVAKYWYVGVLFAVVLILFVILLVITRKR